MENSLNILEESLDKKLLVLQKIQKFNEKQAEVFQQEEPELETFDSLVEEKGRLIEELTRLDDGFETLYGRLAEELAENRQQYAEQIRRLQSKVAEVTEYSMTIQAAEARNKKLVEEYFARKRTHIGKQRKNSKAAYDYYKSMSGANYGINSTWDNKQ